MKKRILMIALMGIVAISAAGCGSTSEQSSAPSEATSEQTSDDQTTAPSESESPSVDITQQTGTHDASTKQNTYAEDLNTATSVEKGKTDTISGTYTLDGVEGVKYAFKDDKAYLIEEGSYTLSDGSIELEYGTNDRTTYQIVETDAGFNLIYDSNFLPLVYMEGDDGLTGTEPFSGIYGIPGAQGFVFTSDGKVSVITTHSDFKVDKSTVTFATGSYDWRVDNGKIILSTNGTDVMTLVPSK